MIHKPLHLTHYSMINALGTGQAASLQALLDSRSGLSQADYPRCTLPTWIGRVAGVEQAALEPSFQQFDCRNNRLARLGLLADGFAQAVAAARERYGAGRIGVFIGTSTSGIAATEEAYFTADPESGEFDVGYDYLHTHNLYSVTDFVRQFLGLTGPALTISTACSSSAKVFATANRYIAAGWCDAAVVGGVDSLCLTTLYGFNSLELVSAQPCRPWGAGRDGINIGEAAAFALLETERGSERDIALLGYGESSDAYHMSTPHPQGEGAQLAMRLALQCAGLRPEQVDYINLHGTATPSNDRSEDHAVNAVFGTALACSSTKGWTGHTLGAAGITEALFCCLSIQHKFAPGTLNTSERDPELVVPVLLENREQCVDIAMSNSFGFGGTNCSLIFGRQC